MVVPDSYHLPRRTRLKRRVGRWRKTRRRHNRKDFFQGSGVQDRQKNSRVIFQQKDARNSCNQSFNLKEQATLGRFFCCRSMKSDEEGADLGFQSGSLSDVHGAAAGLEDELEGAEVGSTTGGLRRRTRCPSLGLESFGMTGTCVAVWMRARQVWAPLSCLQ